MAIMSDAETVKRFTLAGRATLTLQSLATGSHFTYKIDQMKDRATKERVDGKFFVKLLTGPETYKYLGIIDANGFRWTRKSCVSQDAPSLKGFMFFYDKVIRKGEMPGALIIRHEGKCGKCGRELTTPESVDRGIGPECWKAMK